MSIEVSDSNTVQQVIQWVLQSHLKASLTPLLRYDMPEKYELRLHEGVCMSCCHVGNIIMDVDQLFTRGG